MNAVKREGASNSIPGSPVSGKKQVGNQEITSRGYSGGKKMEKLIGAEKLSGPVK